MLKEETKIFNRKLGTNNIKPETPPYGRSRALLEITVWRRSTAE
jgi:hypothetical protein